MSSRPRGVASADAREPVGYVHRLFFCLLLLLSGVAQAMTIGIDQPGDGTKYALLCERVESRLLKVKDGVLWAKMPTYVSVSKSARVDECPMSQGNWFELKTERLRSYQITVRVVRYDAEGNVLSSKVQPPYFYFHGPDAKPIAPVVTLSI